MCEKPIICLLLFWQVLGPLKTFISAFVCTHLCVCQNEGECMREREGAIHVLLIYSIFVVAFILIFAYRSVVRMMQVFDLEKCSISKTLLQVFKRVMTLLCNNGFLIH